MALVIIPPPESSQLWSRDGDGEPSISEGFAALVEHAREPALNDEASGFQRHSHAGLEVNDVDQTRASRSQQRVLDHRQRNGRIRSNDRAELRGCSTGAGEEKAGDITRAADDSQLGRAFEQASEQRGTICSERT